MRAPARFLSPVAFALALSLVTFGAARADELDTLGEAIESQPDNPAAYDAYALAAFKAKRFDDAIKKLKLGVARIPNYSKAYYKLAYAYRQKKEWADAADYYRRYMQLYPTESDPYFGLAASLEGIGDKRGAIGAYEKYIALEKNPAKQRFIEQARAELARLGGVATPSAPPAQATPAPPPPAEKRGDAALLKRAADQLRKDGKLDEAVLAYQKAIEADRGNLELYNDLGNVFFGLKRYNDAAQSFKDATARDAGYALGWYNYAHALRKADRKAEAVEAYQKYIRLKPDDADPYYGLGQTLKGLGDVPGAIAAFRKYVDMEKRPEEQRWVEKARAEMEALEAIQKGRPRPSGKLDEKTELDSAGGLELGLRDPFAETMTSSVLELHLDHGDLLDPFRTEELPLRGLDRSRRLREYGAAIAAYRRALSRQAENVSARYERGAALAINDDGWGAARAWNTIRLGDADVDAARRSIERVRAYFATQTR